MFLDQCLDSGETKLSYDYPMCCTGTRFLKTSEFRMDIE